MYISSVQDHYFTSVFVCLASILFFHSSVFCFYKVSSAKLAAIMIVYVIVPVFEDKAENFRFFKKGNYGGLLNSFRQIYLFDRIIGIFL